MKKATFIMMLIISCIIPIQGQSVNVMTYNIKYDNPSDSLNNWDARKEMVAGLIRFYDMDIFGVQEGLRHQLEYLKENLEDIDYSGVGRDDGKQQGEYSAVFYNTAKFNKISGGTFWLSETPNTPSVGWDASMERICSYVYLKSKESANHFWVFNAHLDHIGPKARLESLKLIHEKIDLLNLKNEPVILMGDFNATPDQAPIEYISELYDDTKKLTAEAPYGPDATFNGFKFYEIPRNRIDYIYVNNEVEAILKYGVLTDSRSCRYPSDHFPVMVRLKL